MDNNAHVKHFARVISDYPRSTLGRKELWIRYGRIFVAYWKLWVRILNFVFIFCSAAMIMKIRTEIRGTKYGAVTASERVRLRLRDFFTGNFRLQEFFHGNLGLDIFCGNIRI